MGAGEGVGAGLVTSGDAAGDCGHGLGSRGRDRIWHRGRLRVWLAGDVGKAREFRGGWWWGYFRNGFRSWLRSGARQRWIRGLSGCGWGSDGRVRGSGDRGGPGLESSEL